MNRMMWPNSARLRRALAGLELFAVCDFFPNPTSDLATVFFPAATHLERQALVVTPGGRVQYRPAAVHPLGQARGDTEFVFEVAGELGLGRRFWDGDIHASYEARLEGLGLSFGDLKRAGAPTTLDVPDPVERGFERHGFGTPTGKVEFVSTILQEAGYEGLPFYREPFWSPVATPGIAEEYPLVLTSGARSRTYSHSQGRQLRSMRAQEPDPRVQISPRDARDRGIQDGEEVRLSSPLGFVSMKAWITDSLPAGIVSAPHGWAEADVNLLIPDAGLDPISGFPPFRSSLCQVERS